MTKVTTATLGLIALAAVGLPGCNAVNHHMTWAAQEDAEWDAPHLDDWHGYQMVYYPSAKVYYEPYTRSYAWMTEKGWVQSQELPAHVLIQASAANFVTVPPTNPEVPIYTAAHADWPADWPAMPAMASADSSN